MGVYIGLKIMPRRIDNDEWHQAYEDSLAFLKACPEQMMSIEREKKYSVERKVFSHRIEHERDNPNRRHWHVVGDYESKRTAESFVLYWDLNHYLSGLPRSSENATDADILANVLNDGSEYREVFFDKTQGNPYHLPMLGVAMLIEARFPTYALADGNIDIHQAKRAQRLVKNLIGKDLDLPVCVDAQRLFQRILQYHQGKKAIECFREIYRGDVQEEFKTLYSLCADTCVEWFVDELRSYHSPGQLGAINLSMSWLSATQNLQTLCEIACLREEGPKFDPVEFAGALASTWISVDESLRKVLDAFHKPKGEADTIMSLFGSILFDMGGLKGRNMEFFMPEQEVFQVFSQCFPDHCKQMEKTFKAKTETIKKDLGEHRQGVDDLVSRCEEEPESGDGSSLMLLKSFDHASPRQKFMLEGMAYAVARTRDMILREQADLLQGTVDELRERIIKATKHNGLILTDDAWEWLDKESDSKFLQYVLSLAAIDNNEQSFWNIRKGMLENRNCCLSAFEMSNDESFMARMETMRKEAAKK